MAKAITITNLDDKCNQAINVKRAELLLQGKDFVKSEVVVAILHDWLDKKYKSERVSVNFDASGFGHSVGNKLVNNKNR